MTTNDTFEDGAPSGLCEHHIDAFLAHLRQAGYSEVTLGKKRRVLNAFSRWMRSRLVVLEHLDETDIAEFVKNPPGARAPYVRFKFSVLRLHLAYLRAETLVREPLPKAEPEVDCIQRQYVEYLRQDRGLAENSVHVYAPFIRDFLGSQNAGDGRISAHAFDAVTLRNYLLIHGKGRSGEYVRLLSTALRSFCRFLFLHGDTVRDHSHFVPTVRTWRQSSVPAFLLPEQGECILAATDRSTPTGRRDYAILLLLARLGLRAGEVVALELGDIHWRSGELAIHGKGQMVEHVPLLSDIGEALARYLYEDRGASASRRVFLRMWAPHVGLTGPAAIGHIVRLAFARAGFRPSCRGAAHLFRHGLATTMIRHGASMAEIAEVLRHRSQDSSAIYAKVSFESLRGVARPWPTTGGA
ncbi:tyrosine-type recombinase/integrase [Accumulibacter sp.]|jgi:Site-specific recombinase XerD|uniref:tyrosine-type recombinase/integrase n=1 Tax=Accumulibacter sp. TaxID=2053492 RepID=UPI001AD1BEB9|nr:tyrosine-type recombinase/integrase [Accumulibacter sp.]MBN8516138.1 tyrosine-type recombinase/integrase [Accumulibacter sp.]MBO3702342.1 tyrosine-type recombinase/integrase [Accumulibacter sp.]